MQNSNQPSQLPLHDPAEFRPRLEGRLFTAIDSVVDPTCSIHPTASLLYDTLPSEYQDVFKNCRMYLSKHLDFVKVLKSISEKDLKSEDVDLHLLQPLCIPLSTTDKKRWKCGVVGCGKTETSQHICAHLQRRTHLNLPLFPCRYCESKFKLPQDRVRHETNKHPDASSPQRGSSHSERDISQHTVTSQPLTSQTRLSETARERQLRPPVHCEAMDNENIPSLSETSSEVSDHSSAETDPWSLPSPMDSNTGHQVDIDQSNHVNAWLKEGPHYLRDPKSVSQTLSGQFVATQGAPAISDPIAGTVHPFGWPSVLQPCTADGYKPNSHRQSDVQAQNQPYFACPTQQPTPFVASSSSGTLPASTCNGHRLESMGVAPAIPIQPTGNSGMNAYNIINNIHIHGVVDPSQIGVYNPPMQTVQTPTHGLPLGYPQPQGHFRTTVPEVPQVANDYPNYIYQWTPTSNVNRGLQQRPGPTSYPHSFAGYGTSLLTPCTSRPLGRGLMTPCLRKFDQADAFKSRLSLSGQPWQAPDSPQDFDKSAWAPRQQGIPTLGEKPENGCQISISDPRTRSPSASSAILPRYSLDLVNEKSISATTKQPLSSVTGLVGGVRVFIICCLIAALLSASLLVYEEWPFGIFDL